MSFRKTVLCVCSTSLATSTQYLRTVEDIAREIKVPVKLQNIASQTDQLEQWFEKKLPAHLVVGSPFAALRKRVPQEIPVVDGIPLLTGIGKDKVVAQIKEILLKK